MPTRTLRDGEKYELQQLLEAPGKAGTKGTYNGCGWHRVKSKGETTWKLRDLGARRWQVFASSQEAVAWVAGEPPDTGPRGESSIGIGNFVGEERHELPFAKSPFR